MPDAFPEGTLFQAKKERSKYVMHIEAGKMPPFKVKEFRSITAYNDEDVLIENPIDRYAISNRTDFETNEDGSVDGQRRPFKSDSGG